MPVRRVLLLWSTLAYEVGAEGGGLRLLLVVLVLLASDFSVSAEPLIMSLPRCWGQGWPRWPKWSATSTVLMAALVAVSALLGPRVPARLVRIAIQRMAVCRALPPAARGTTPYPSAQARRTWSVRNVTDVIRNISRAQEHSAIPIPVARVCASLSVRPPALSWMGSARGRLRECAPLARPSPLYPRGTRIAMSRAHSPAPPGTTRADGDCVPCTPYCTENGYYSDGVCEHSSNNVCVPCVGPPANAYFNRVGSCDSECLPEFYSNEDEPLARCLRCRESCGVGETLSGECRVDENPVCDPCDNRDPNSEYVAENSCAWECNRDFYRSGGRCVRCTVECGDGQYLTGDCTPLTNTECVDCTNRPANAEYTSPGLTYDGNDCEFLCTGPRYYNAQTRRCDVCPVLGDCAVGQWLSGACSPTSTTQCVPCTNVIPAASRYSGTGRRINSCPFACIDMYYYSGIVDDCILCDLEDSCVLGQSLTGECTPTSNPTCEDCQDIPDNASAVDLGCGWECDEGYHQDMLGEACVECVRACDPGLYLSGMCSQWMMTECVECTNAPEESRYTTAGDRDTNNCGFVCNVGRTFDEASNVCQECTVDDDCAAGEVLTGGACSTDNNPTCGPCEPSTLPPNGQYATPGTCDFVCNTQFVRVGELCPACTVVCPTGSYPSGQCSGSTDYECTPCENRREGTYFTGTPGTVNDPESCGVDDCTSRCNAGLTPAGECTPFENPRVRAMHKRPGSERGVY